MTENLGERIRRRRVEKKLGLREAAGKIGISPTYLSRIETCEERNPPAEHVIRAISELLGDNFDELMALAGRLPSDVKDYLISEPGMPEFLRTAREQGVGAAELHEALKKAVRKKK